MVLSMHDIDNYKRSDRSVAHKHIHLVVVGVIIVSVFVFSVLLILLFQSIWIRFHSFIGPLNLASIYN